MKNNKFCKELASEGVTFKDGHMTLGRLRQFVRDNTDLPSDTPVLYERIEDIYFDKFDWKTEGFHYEEDINNYVYAFTIFKAKNNKGEQCVLLTAHY